MALNSLSCAYVPLSNYSVTLGCGKAYLWCVHCVGEYDLYVAANSYHKWKQWSTSVLVLSDVLLQSCLKMTTVS